MSSPLKLTCLISGGGRTVLNLADEIDAGKLDASIELIIASRENIAGVQRLRDRRLKVRIGAKKDFDLEDALHDQVTSWITEAGTELVCLCGYLRLLRMDPPLIGRVINIHPALLPDFGGQGLYGEHVQRAVIESGRRVSGCTVHFVDELYDHGPTILQRACPILPEDDTTSLAARVFEQECRALPEAIRLIASKRVKLLQGRVHISPMTSDP